MVALEKVDEYLESVEEYFYSSMSAVTHGLPDVHEVVNRLWVDISRYGPGMPAFPDVHIPSLGDFQVPPPPPEPTSLSFLDASGGWIRDHPWKVSGIVVGVLGAGLLVGYNQSLHRRRRATIHHKGVLPTSGRRQVVVIIGGDTPYGLPLILELEKRGFIVIASVSSPDAIDVLEQNCHGYVKALVLDPEEPSTVPVFLRSLMSTLARRFPLKSAGDPHTSPSSHPYIQSIVSLLTLPSTAPGVLAPLEHISLRNDYVPYLNVTQITPIQVVQQLLPLLRTGSARSRDKDKKSIIMCLPAIDTRVGLPFSSVQAMSAVGTLRATEILRREINMAALTDQTESMKNIKVVIVDVGGINTGVNSKGLLSQGAYKAMEGWTASEKLTYGTAFVTALHEARLHMSHWEFFKSLFEDGPQYRLERKHTDMSVLVDNLVCVITGGRSGPTICGINFGLGHVRNWIRGDRFSVGAGVNTYKIASHLPSVILEALLEFPHFLIGLRNRLLPVLPFQHLPDSSSISARATDLQDPIINSQTVEAVESENETETFSEPDTENNASGSVESSWVNLNKAK